MSSFDRPPIRSELGEPDAETEAAFAELVASKRFTEFDLPPSIHPGPEAEVAMNGERHTTNRDETPIRDEPEVGPAPKPDGNPLADIQPIYWPTFWELEIKVEEWLVEPVVPKGRQVALYSPPKEGKSLAALEWAAAKATGAGVLGSPAGEPVDVVYIDQEMTEDDLRERLDDLGYGPNTDLSHLHYYQLSNLPPLDTKHGGRTLVGIAQRDNACWVVVDTVASSVEGAEDSADTLRAFWSYTGLPLKQAGIALLRLDHMGKEPGRGQRGTSQKNADIDVVFRLSALDSEGFVVLKRTHTRISWVPPEVKMRRETDPYLRHVLAPTEWPAGTAEVAALLNELKVPLDAGRATAGAALKEAGKGRRNAVISAALKYRRGRDNE